MIHPFTVFVKAFFEDFFEFFDFFVTAQAPLSALGAI
jgi:hypothetical protein